MDKGAHYLKADLQIHTPRDVNWVCNGIGIPCSEIDRRKCAEDFIRKCRNENIRIIAITDHHDMAFVKYIQEAARNEKDETGNLISYQNQIYVFPGMELTILGGFQAVILLNPTCTDEHFNALMGKLAIHPAPESAAHSSDVTQLDYHNFNHIEDDLNKADLLKNNFIILPHVGKNGSLGTILKNGNHSMYKTMTCVGGYIGHDLTRHDKPLILTGKDTHWGSKSIGVFQTSDSREFTQVQDVSGETKYDFPKLGSLYTWVKVSEPTVEAIRQACLANETRICQTIPKLPQVYITKIKVSDSKFLGTIELEFNKQFNALIGGRGTGKSTILEYIRWALCDQVPEIRDDEIPEIVDFQDKRATLINKTLKSKKAIVELSFELNGINHTVKKNAQDDTIELKIGDGEFKESSESEIRNLLPIQAYSQKQLSVVAIRKFEIQRFITIPIQKELEKIEYALNNCASKIRENYAVLQRKRAIESEIKKLENSVTSLQLQAKSLRGKLSNIDKKDQELIDKNPLYKSEVDLLKKWTGEIDVLEKAIIGIQDKISELPTDYIPNDLSLNKDQLIELNQLLSKSVTDVRSKIDTILTDVKSGPNRLKINERQALLGQKYDEYFKQYASAVGKYQDNKVVLDNLKVIEDEINSSKEILNDKKKMLKEIGDVEKNIESLWGEWVTIHNTRTELLARKCDELSQLSSQAIKASLIRGNGIFEIASDLKDAFKGSRVQENKINALCTNIATSDNPIKNWLDFIKELENLSITEVGAILPNTPILDAAVFQENDKTRIGQKLTFDKIIELGLHPIIDQPIFQYKTSENNYIDFSDASAGQQATALLTVLLNQQGPPLIIDQPEDDIDNPTIQQIIDLLKSAKEKRQIIISSHNANLVVNGDAELLIWCANKVTDNHAEGEIKDCGSIDKKSICDTIQNIMEGGKKAFMLRKDKYGF